MTPSSPLLEVTDLSCRFPVGDGAFLHAVDGVSFALERGASLGVVGESGSGKSTLVRLTTRVIDPTAGSIRFAGVEIGTTSFEHFARSPMRGRIQMVFQDPTDSLNPRWSAEDAIADPIRRLGIVAGRAAIRARVAELAALVDLPEALLGRYPHQLSGGQKARVGIARALATNPDLLVLDEPTSALDVSVQAVILKLLASLRRKLGIAYLFVSHDLDVIRLLCERVMVMYMGTIVEQGTVGAVFTRPAHPYTRALVAAISPDPASEPDGVLGEPGSPIDPPVDACRFRDACPIAQPICGTSRPPLRRISADQATACHFAS